MLPRTALLGLAAIGAQALLVIPEMEPQVDSIDETMNIQPVFDDITYGVLLPCTDCPFREVSEEGVVSWTDGKPSSLLLEFSVEDNRLLANSHQIFPPVPPLPITATQHADIDGQDSGPMPVGYALEVMPLPAPADAPGTDLLDVRFTILDLESHPVPVDTVAITLIHTPSGNLYIADTNVEKTAPPPEKLSWKKCNGKPKCLQELVLSRIQDLLHSAKDRVIGMGKAGRKGCHGKHKGAMGIGGYHKHHDEEGLEGPMGLRPHHPHGDHFNPEGVDGRPHHHPHHHGHHAGPFARTFSRIVRFIIIPALIGVLAGLAASAIGMLVGQAVIFLWQRYRGNKSQEHKAAWEDGNITEKQGLMTESHEEEQLPEYTEGSTQSRNSFEEN